MNKYKVIARKHLPSHFPLIGTLTWILILDRFHAPAWLWGVALTLLVIDWAAILIAIYNQNPTELKELKD